MQPSVPALAPAFAPSVARVVAMVVALAAASPPAQAQFSVVPVPATTAPPRESAAEIEKEYRIDGARHLYAAYPSRIFKGKLPPLVYSVMVVETEIDAAGQVLGVQVVRRPAAPEVQPWVISMIQRAAPFPAPAKMPEGRVRYLDIWLVDKSGRFQIDTLTEGQR